MDMSSQQFADIYWNAQPAEVRALRYMTGDARAQAAYQLALRGFLIDVPIMANNWDPLKTMTQRQVDGYAWVPSGLQPNIPLGPGLTFPGLPAYDGGNPPPGSIKVSIDPADYPSQIPPAPVLPDPNERPVGASMGNIFPYKQTDGTVMMLPGFFPAYGSSRPAVGTIISQDGVRYVFGFIGGSLMDPANAIGVWLRLP